MVSPECSERAQSARKFWASKAQKTRDLEVKLPEKALHLSDEKSWRVLRLNPYIEKELLVTDDSKLTALRKLPQTLRRP